MKISEEFKITAGGIAQGGNWFVTGKAGTGKTTFIAYLKERLDRKLVVLAPTGMAAINAGGQTIHSFFKLPPRLVSQEVLARVRVRRGLLEKLETIVIDEASMVRADLLDGIDWLLKKYRGSDLPFGGVQMVLVGDLFQLPPVVNQEEAWVLAEKYESPYFFSAASFKQANFQSVEFGKIYRHEDVEFVTFLNKVRWGLVERADLERINERLKFSERSEEKAVLLTSTNYVAEALNLRALDQIDKNQLAYEAKIEGEFPVGNGYLPTGTELVLKEGARVMMVKNDRAGRYVNGSLGIVSRLGEKSVMVALDEGGEVKVGRDEWEYVRYEAGRDGRVEARIAGRFRQLPLRLAWAMTIHKSQGMTFDRVHIDLSRNPFAHGQTYVALSRCKTLEGLSLSRDLKLEDVMVDPAVIDFSRQLR